MSVIQISQQTNLAGQPLRDAITRMVQDLGQQSRYRAMNVQASWAGSRLSLRAGDHMTGTIDVRDGPPSTVTAQINLLSGIARMMEGTVREDMMATIDRHMGAPVVSAPGTVSHPAPAAPAGTGVPATPAAAAEPDRQRRPFNWGAFGSAMTGLFSGAATVFDQYSLVGQQAEVEAVAIAKEASPIGPDTGVQTGPGFILGQGKAVGPDAPLPGGRLPSDVPPGEGATEPVDVGLPTWAWWAIGIGGVAAVGALGVLLLRKQDEEEDFRETIGYDDTVGYEEFERNREPARVRAYRKMLQRGRGPKRRRLRPRSDMRREALAMREAGFSISEISRALGINRKMVKSYFIKERLSA